MIRAVLILTILLCTVPAWGQAQCGESRMDAVSSALAESLVENLQVRLDRTAPIMTAPFADLHTPKRTSPLGRILAEEIGNALFRYGYRIADPRVFMPSPYTLKEHRETALAVDPDQAGAATGAQIMLTGTYALADGGLRISARLVNIPDHSVLTTASCRLRLTEEVQLLLASSSPAAKTHVPPTRLLDLKNKADVKRVQQALAAQGLNPGKIDGVWGKKSKAALLRFRASLAMPATSTWDLSTQNALLPAS